MSDFRVLLMKNIHQRNWGHRLGTLSIHHRWSSLHGLVYKIVTVRHEIRECVTTLLGVPSLIDPVSIPRGDQFFNRRIFSDGVSERGIIIFSKAPVLFNYALYYLMMLTKVAESSFLILSGHQLTFERRIKWIVSFVMMITYLILCVLIIS